MMIDVIVPRVVFTGAWRVCLRVGVDPVASRRRDDDAGVLSATGGA